MRPNSRTEVSSTTGPARRRYWCLSASDALLPRNDGDQRCFALVYIFSIFLQQFRTFIEQTHRQLIFNFSKNKYGCLLEPSDRSIIEECSAVCHLVFDQNVGNTLDNIENFFSLFWIKQFRK